MSEHITTFEGDHVFFVMGQGWYHESPSGQIDGPYASRDVAKDPTPRHPGPVRFMSDRLFYIAGKGWFAHTREGDRGPFASKRDVQRFVTSMVENGNTRRTKVW